MAAWRRTRLEAAGTLRDLGLDLATVKRVLDHVTVGDVAALHAEALPTKIRTLGLRRAVLRAVAKRGTDVEGMDLMNNLAG